MTRTQLLKSFATLAATLVTYAAVLAPFAVLPAIA